MVEHDDPWPTLVEGVCRGDPQALRDFYVQYGPLLHGLAARQLTGGIRRRVEPEDVVQSVCRTFLRRAQRGEFELDDSAGLWGLLCAITLNKVRKLLRFHRQHKRDLNREVRAGPESDDESAASFPVPSSAPSPPAAAEFDDELRRLLETLDEEQRQVVHLKLQDYTNKEVAKQLGFSERTVRRIMKVVQAHLARQREAADDDR